MATRRVLRAVLKATDLCVTEPAQVARRIVDGGFTAQYDYALRTLSEVPYDRWRDYDAEDTIRFYALRLHEAGLIKSGPQKRSEEHTSELQSHLNLVCRLLLEKKKKKAMRARGACTVSA